MLKGRMVENPAPFKCEICVHWQPLLMGSQSVGLPIKSDVPCSPTSKCEVCVLAAAFNGQPSEGPPLREGCQTRTPPKWRERGFQPPPFMCKAHEHLQLFLTDSISLWPFISTGCECAYILQVKTRGWKHPSLHLWGPCPSTFGPQWNPSGHNYYGLCSQIRTVIWG